ncbi:hypothetical protein JTE90_014023 [Oedothorax gibbosus]|uniref:Gustatory receptor n=1 Tax=Oedothorax gibbosus TaxID=931172 RepID=A0AAV6UDQ1_9ARAC|nr:hypothetical protein JTE90_014023 [Oedothorax gibbosus]
MRQISWIIRLFYSVGIILPTDDESTFRRVLSKTVDWIYVLFTAYLIGTDFYLVFVLEKRKVPLGFVISAFCGDFCNIAIRLVYMTRRSFIVPMLQKIQFAHQKLENKSNRGRRMWILVLVVCASWIYPCAMFAMFVRVLMTEKGPEVLQTGFFFMKYINQETVMALLVLIQFFMLQQMYVAPGYFIGLCCYSYATLKLIIRRSERNLMKKNQLCTFERYYFNITRHIVDCAISVEKALSRQLAILFNYLVAFIFIMMTLFLKDGSRIISSGLWLPNLSILFLALLAFYSLSIQASDIHTSALRMRKLVYNFCSKMDSPNNIDSNRIRFLLLVDSDAFPDKVVMSGWGMFVLNRNFILQTTGAIITYGAVILQIEKK